MVITPRIGDAPPRVLACTGLNRADQQGYADQEQQTDDHDHEVHQSPPIATGRHADRVAGCGTPQVYFARCRRSLQTQTWESQRVHPSGSSQLTDADTHCGLAYPYGRFLVGLATRTIALVAGLEVDVPSSEGPLLHRRRLGVELRRLRGDRTLDEVAEGTLISTSKLSRLETGQGVPHPRDIRDLVNYYDLDGQTAERLRRWANAGRSQAWWREYTRELTANLDTYLDYEAGASTIRIFALSTVPALLQTAAYSAQLYRAIPPSRSEETVRKLVEALARRKKIVVEADPAPELIVVLDEAVLRRPFGSPDDVREQLDHLHTMSRHRRVSLRVVPFAAGPHAGLQGLFTILQYADDIDRDIVAVESHTGERLLEQPSSVLEYLRIFDAISRKALDPDESRKLIAEVRGGVPSPKGTK